MAKSAFSKSRATPAPDRRPRPEKAGFRIRKTMEIDKSKLSKARRILGSDSDTQTVDRALDVIIANQEIGSAIETVFGSLPDFEVP